MAGEILERAGAQDRAKRPFNIDQAGRIAGAIGRQPRETGLGRKQDGVRGLGDLDLRRLDFGDREPRVERDRSGIGHARAPQGRC